MKRSQSQSDCGYVRERIYQKSTTRSSKITRPNEKVAIRQHTNRKLSAEKGNSFLCRARLYCFTSFTAVSGDLYSTFRASGYSNVDTLHTVCGHVYERRCIRVPPPPHNKQRVGGPQTSFQYDDTKYYWKYTC
ncbi:unnamed protein product [Ectocarpus sp. 8 AP-2014]